MEKNDLKNLQVIIADIDGTAVPVSGSKISPRLKEAIGHARELGIVITFATGRSFTMARQIFEQLDHRTPVIISAGTEIVDPKTGELKWGLKLSESQIEDIKGVLRPYDPLVHLVNASHDEFKKLSEREILGEQQTLFLMDIAIEQADEIKAKIDEIEMVRAHETTAWSGKNTVDVHITHQLADKQHTTTELLTILEIDRRFAAAVGDSGNDLPLFEAVDFKVAMGNASDVLKLASDIVIDSVDNEGLAHFIETVVAAQSG